jgi:RNA polymerase sigma-70 factor (ECF subfamily)
MNRSLFTEVTAAEAFRSGDVAGFDWLVERYLAKASRVANGILRSGEDAEDLAHEAFVKAWDQRQRLIAGREFGPWLMRIVRNLALDLLRHRRSVRLEPFALEATAPLTDRPDTLAHSRLLGGRIRDAFEHLPPRQRTVASLFLVYGFRHSEIARMTSLPEGTVRSHLSVARKRLRRELADVA